MLLEEFKATFGKSAEWQRGEFESVAEYESELRARKREVKARLERIWAMYKFSLGNTQCLPPVQFLKTVLSEMWSLFRLYRDHFSSDKRTLHYDLWGENMVAEYEILSEVRSQLLYKKKSDIMYGQWAEDLAAEIEDLMNQFIKSFDWIKNKAKVPEIHFV